MHNTLLKDYSGHGVALGLMAFLVVSAIAVGVGYIRWWSLFCYVWLTYSVAYTSLWLLKRHSQREPSLGVAIVVALVSIGLGAASAFYLTSAASNLTWAGSYIEAMTLEKAGVTALFVAAVVFFDLLRRYQEIRRQRNALEQERRRAERAEINKQILEAQLQVMQAQVEPHFLFNTLANVRHLVHHNADQADATLLNLIRYLREALPQMRESTSSLGREFKLAEAYLNIMRIRMGERLQFSLDLPKPLEATPFPPMMLISLVENAIKHGLEPSDVGGSISLHANHLNGKLVVQVADSGLGFDSGSDSGDGVGLSNIRSRLRTLYDNRATLRLEAAPTRGMIATIEIPENP